MGATTRFGLVLLIVGVGGFLYADTVISQGSTSVGQLERGISESQQSQFETFVFVRIASGVAAAAGAGLIVIGSLSSNSRKAEASTGAPQQSRAVLTVPPGEFRVVEFDIGKPHILDYTIEVLNGPSVNVIVTDQSQLETFADSPNIGWIENASRVDTSDATVTSQLGPRDYAFIIDNTGRSHSQTATSPAKINLVYELTPSQ
jgi:hypothetical protein